MIRIFLLLSFLLTCNLSFSQILIQKRAEFKVTLPEQVDPIITNGFYINEIEISSAVGKVIGSAQIGLKKRRVDAVLDESIKLDFLRISNQLISPSRGAIRLKLKIIKIRVDERTNFTHEEGTANLAIQVIHKKESGKEVVLYAKDTVASVLAISDVSSKLGFTISKALSSLLSDFSLCDWRSSFEIGLIETESNIYNLPNQEHPYTDPIQEGVYLTPTALLERNPSTRTIEIINRNSYKDKRFKIYFTDKQKRVPIFAAFIDSTFYISEAVLNGGNASKKSVVKFEHGIPYLYGEATVVDPIAQGFGAIGSAIGTKRYGVVLDIRTGNVITLIDELLYKLTQDHVDLRKYIAENRQLKPIGSRKIIMSLNERFSEDKNK